MIGKAPRLGEPGGMHEDRQPEFLCFGEDLAEAVGGQVLAGDVGGDLDAAQPKRSMQSCQLVNRQFRRLKRHRAKADEAIGMRATMSAMLSLITRAVAMPRSGGVS